MNENTQEQINNTDTNGNKVKPRLISMLVLAISIGVATPVLIALIVGQTLFGLFAAEANDAMKNLSKQITDYIYDALNYLSFNSEVRPFPYQGWSDKAENQTANSAKVEQTV